METIFRNKGLKMNKLNVFPCLHRKCQVAESGALLLNKRPEMLLLIVACTCGTSGGPSAARRSNFKKRWPCRTMAAMGDHQKQHVGRKQHNTWTWFLFVPHLGSGPVHSCSPCAVSGLHQAEPVPEACTGRPAHSLTSGLHRREGSLLNLLPLPISICNSLSLLSFLHPCAEGSTGHSHQGKDDEQLYNWASWLFSSRTVPVFPSSFPPPPPPQHPHPSQSLFPFSSIHLTPVWQGKRLRVLSNTALWQWSSCLL